MIRLPNNPVPERNGGIPAPHFTPEMEPATKNPHYKPNSGYRKHFANWLNIPLQQDIGLPRAGPPSTERGVRVVGGRVLRRRPAVLQQSRVSGIIASRPVCGESQWPYRRAVV